MKAKSLMIVLVMVAGIGFALPDAGHARWYGWRGGWGWYGPAAFAGGVVVGAAIARPWYWGPYYGPYPAPAYVYPPPVYAYPRPVVVYTAPPAPAYFPNQAYAYPDPTVTSRQGPPVTSPRASRPSSGQWVEVPGQSVNGQWVPAHKAWVPDSP